MLLLFLFGLSGFFQNVYSLEKFFPREFDYIIPLGGMCQTAYHLRRLNLIQENYGFEWLLTPAASVAALFINNFEGFLSKNHMYLINGPEVVANPDAFSNTHWKKNNILDQFYNIRLTHDYRRNNDFMLDHEKIVEKYKRRFDRLRNVLRTASDESKTILFVRRQASKREALLIEFSIQLVYPNLDFILLVVDEIEGVKADWGIPRIVNRYLMSGKWPGNDEEWNRVLSEIVINKRSPDSAPSLEGIKSFND